MTERLFLDFSLRKLQLLAERIETCLGRLTAQQIWARGGENQNAVGNLVLHLCGNARQWIVSALGNQPDARERDAEFNARGGMDAAELIARLRAVIAEITATLESMPPSALTRRLTIQRYEVSALEAIYHVVEHFSMHTGQIIFAAKALTGEDFGYYRHISSGAAHGQKTP